jgi:hypothetical protein
MLAADDIFCSHIWSQKGKKTHKSLEKARQVIETFPLEAMSLM